MKLSLYLLILFYVSAFATVSTEETQSYKDINNYIKTINKKYGSDKVLIVLDIDNTILTSSAELGGDLWYRWQTKKLSIKPSSEQTIKCLYNDAIVMLYELNPMNLVDENISLLINNWQNTNTVIALTSRSPKNRTATERELNKYNIFFEKEPIKDENNRLLILDYKLSRAFSYINGIMMTTGMNKGIMINRILYRTNRQYEAIVFVDDSVKNIKNVENIFKKDSINVKLFYYTKVDQERIKKNGSLFTKEDASRLSKEWATLEKNLKLIFPQRNNKECSF